MLALGPMLLLAVLPAVLNELAAGAGRERDAREATVGARRAGVGLLRRHLLNSTRIIDASGSIIGPTKMSLVRTRAIAEAREACVAEVEAAHLQARNLQSEEIPCTMPLCC